MNERVSRLIDAELDTAACTALLNDLGRDRELRRAWDTYHLIGDVLRETGCQGVRREVFLRRLEAEPTVLAPALRTSARRPTKRVMMSAAAGLSAVAFVAWMALPTFMPASGPDTAQAGAASSLASAADTSGGASTAVPVARDVEDYLLAHQRFSPTFAMQGAVPYVRMVSEESKGPSR